MCGIIGYFGDSANGLTRILGAMASILYRAPDSTGAAWFGDEREPLRVRKTVGALSRFVETQLSEGTHPGEAEILARLCTDAGAPPDRRALQRALLRWEGFADHIQELEEAADFRDLIDPARVRSPGIVPGTCGDPSPAQSYRIASVEDFSRFISDGIEKYDLPPLVARTLARKALTETLGGSSDTRIDEQTAGRLLDELFQQAMKRLNLIIPTAEPELKKANLPQVGGKVYRQFLTLLRDSTVYVPGVCSTDPVSWLFRLLDGSLLSRLSVQTNLRENIQQTFEDQFAGRSGGVRLPWTAVYLAEKGLNVFGRAAAAVWTYLSGVDLPVVEQVGEDAIPSPQPESTPAWRGADPTALRYFCSPIIAHGRWALQSPVSDENAHPFLDAEGRRAIVLNGQFSPSVEEDLRKFLTQAGFDFRSKNSAEYLSVLWGHYFDMFRYERMRGETIQAQVDGGLDGYCLGSQTIDYRVFSMIKGKTESELDALAFREAAAKISADGGQMAAAGISLHSPRCLFVASHNRPVFVVRRRDTEEVMVVSDINAALGLFSQNTIQEKAQELKKLRSPHDEQTATLRRRDGGPIRNRNKDLKDKEERVLDTFRVVVLPLEGEQQFARIETCLEKGTLRRTVTDFNGHPITDIEEFETVLNPLQVEKEVFASFFETHLREIPDRFQDILDAYLPEGTNIPRLTLRRRLLIRRFDQGLTGLKRVVLVGMGSSYHAGLMARSWCSQLLPEVETLLLRPVEVEHALRLMEPEKDLVILLSWSGTTADMVEFARELEASKISFIVVTNKPYSELGLFAWRSLGVVNLLSGEEVTFSSVKSTCSMLFGVQLLVVWLAGLSGHGGMAETRLADLSTLPANLKYLLDDPELEQTVLRWAEQSAGCSMGFVFDDLMYANTGREAAWKLEENGRSIVCRALDYRDTVPQSLFTDGAETLVFVNATSKTRLGEAVELMKRLFLAGVRFYALSYEHSQVDQLLYYSRDQLLIVPKLDDAYQPYIDLVFFYLLTLRLIEKTEDGVPGFPRNRAKSVTTARSRQQRFPLPAAALAALKNELDRIADVPAPDFATDTLWERLAHADWEREIYRQARAVSELLSREDPLGALFVQPERTLGRLGSGLFDELGEGGEVLFLCCDRTAWAAGYEAAAVWGRLLQVPLRVFYRLEELYREKEMLPIVVIASAVPEQGILEQFRKNTEYPICWIGPRLEEKYQRTFDRSLGCYALCDDSAPSAYSNLYAGVLLLLTTAWRQAAGGKGRTLQSLLCSAGKAVKAVLEDGDIKESIDSFWRRNRQRDTAFYISPPSGIGYIWEQIFDATGALCMEHHVYGDSAHGPIATVDPRVEEKYVRLRSRDELVKRYGEDRVSEWQSSYGIAVIDQPSRTSTGQFEELRKHGLLHVEDGWYLPLYTPEYEVRRDNLIILDATRNRYFEQARDEMEIFASRNARMLLVSQRSFHASISEEQLLAGCTAGEPVLLPAVNGGPIPDLLLPFVSQLLAAAFAAGCLAAKGISGRTPLFTSREEKKRLLQERLHLLGEILVSGHIDLGHFDHRLLAALERLAPLVGCVEEAVQFEVQRFASEKRLLGFTEKQETRQTEEIIEHFRIASAQGAPFYLMKAQSRLDPAGSFESEKREWQEVFGISWEALSSGLVQIGEGTDGHPLIEVPLLPASKRKGLFLRLFVSYLEWDHSQGFDNQIGKTLDAMQRGMMSLKSESPGYLTIVNSFNSSMQISGETWADWLIALVPRSWLLYKPSVELAALLVERVEQLLKLDPAGEVRLDEVGALLASAWESFGKIETLKEPSRWRILVARLKKELRGGR